MVVRFGPEAPLWGCSSIGRALVWQTRGCGIVPRRFHHKAYAYFFVFHQNFRDIVEARLRRKTHQTSYVGTWRSLVAHLIWDQGVKSSNLFVPTIRTCTYFFALGAAACWFESSLPEHYREVGKMVKPAIISQVKLHS